MNNLLMKIKFLIYKSIWFLSFLIIMIIVNFSIDVYNYLYPIMDDLIIRSDIKQISQNITYTLFYYFNLLSYNIQFAIMDNFKLLISLLDMLVHYSFCAMYFTYFLLKQYFFFIIACGKHEYAFLWGEAITDIKFQSLVLNKIIYIICDSLTIFFIALFKVQLLTIIIITMPFILIYYIVKFWFSLHINISLFTFLFIIIPFGIRVYYDQWKTYWIDYQQNAEIYTFEYYGHYDYYEDMDLYKYLGKTILPYFFSKLSILLYSIGKLGLLLHFWFLPIMINFLLLLLILNFILFICYLSCYNLAFKHLIYFPIYYPYKYFSRKKKIWDI